MQHESHIVKRAKVQLLQTRKSIMRLPWEQQRELIAEVFGYLSRTASTGPRPTYRWRAPSGITYSITQNGGREFGTMRKKIKGRQFAYSLGRVEKVDKAKLEATAERIEAAARAEGLLT
jgi:hypothetical protein